MAKILTFQKKESAASGQVFLTDEAEKLSFCIAEDGAVSVGAFSSTALSAMPDPRKDWANQELADLFRVRQLLSGANVPVETLRGITDEGDPWFVFCHLNGDVFIHIARIDGLYVLDSPNVRRPLRGCDFNALVADFTNLALPAKTDKDEGTERRVIRLERGGNVRLHPSAMLAALIWTLFLASEDLVLLSPEPEEQSGDNDDLLNFSDVISADFDFQTLAMETTATADLSASESSEELHQEMKYSLAETQLVRETIGQQGLAVHQNGFAMALSTISIAMGFMSEMVLLDNQRKVLEGLKSVGLTEYASDAEAGRELDQIVDGGDNTLLQMLGDFLNIDVVDDTKTADAAREGATNSLIQQDMLHVTVDVVDKNALLSQAKTEKPTIHDNDTSGAHAEPAFRDTAPDTETLFAMADTQQGSSTINIDTLITGSFQMQDIQLGKTTVSSSFDMTKVDTFFLSDYFNSSQRTTNHSTFNDRAQAFIDFIKAKDAEIGIVMSGDAIIMIDRSAYTYQGDGQAYYLTWEDDYGQVVSVIGLKTEFQDFDLIA